MQIGIRAILTLFAVVALLAARARQLGVPFDGAPGPLNAITDIEGLEVGHTTLISGDGKQAVRTGVTAIWPRGKQFGAPVFGGWFSLNGNGEMTGTTWVGASQLRAHNRSKGNSPSRLKSAGVQRPCRRAT